MEIKHTHCAGLDVHKKTVVACRVTPNENGKQTMETRTFSTMTPRLLEMADWLSDGGVTHVAMESTGEYWRPVYNILEERFALLLVNAKHIKMVPGRKADVKDAEWIAELLQHGLLRASFIPSKHQRVVKDLTRHRENFVRERINMCNRIQKTLEDANIKMASVATDILGVSGRSMLRAIVEGETDPTVMVEMSRGRLRDKRDDLQDALTGFVKPHHRVILAQLLRQVDSINESIAELNAAIEHACQWAPPGGEGGTTMPSPPECDEDGVIVQSEGPLSFAEAVCLLDTIPGIARTTAEIIVGEIGTDMTKFKTAGHLAAWVGVAPGNNVSGGKRLSGKSRNGNPFLKKTLIQSGHSAARTKDTYLSDQYHRLVPRRGSKRAVMAVAHSIIVIAWHMLFRKEAYRDLGPNYLDAKRPERTKQTCISRLKRLGFDVTLTPRNAADTAQG
jgi:transposase